MEKRQTHIHPKPGFKPATSLILTLYDRLSRQLTLFEINPVDISFVTLLIFGCHGIFWIICCSLLILHVHINLHKSPCITIPSKMTTNANDLQIHRNRANMHRDLLEFVIVASDKRIKRNVKKLSVGPRWFIQENSKYYISSIVVTVAEESRKID